MEYIDRAEMGALLEVGGILEMPPEGAEYKTSAEIAAMLRVSPQSVTKRCRRGEIPGARRFGSRWRIPVRTSGGDEKEMIA